MTQAEALKILKTGANVFLTGEPGSGKTHTINQYAVYLRACEVEPAITASTGIAATHIGGLTIHSWSNIGIKRDLTKHDLDCISQNKNTSRRVGDARILIIDEVSMLSARTLSTVDAVCREIRRSQKPFGGLQVILVGDFFQLPPVSRREIKEEQKQASFTSNDISQQEEFAYRSDVWKTLNPVVCYLSEQHRQEDVKFLEFLQRLRRADIAESHRILLRKRYSPKPKDGVTELYSHNADVDAINNIKLGKLPGENKVFEMEERGSEKLVAALKRGCLSPEKLTLKIGARVMFTKNDIVRRSFVNGTLGIISGFAPVGYPIVKTNTGKKIFAETDEWRIEDGGRVLARIKQIPLRLAWAMTVHKSQGMSLDAAHMDLSQTFEYGQGYVALSRVRTLAGLSLAGLNSRALEVHPETLTRDVWFREASLKAQEKFVRIPEQKLQNLHKNFINACGGRYTEMPVVNVDQLIEKRTAASRFKKKSRSTYEVTKALVARKLSLKDMAKERGMTLGTIINHLEKLVAEEKIEASYDLAHFKIDPSRFKEIKKALEDVGRKEGRMLLSPARKLLDDSYSYEELRLVRLFVKQLRRNPMHY